MNKRKNPADDWGASPPMDKIRALQPKINRRVNRALDRVIKRKNRNAVALGRRGGIVRRERMSLEERSEAARRAVQARWAKRKP